MEGFSNIHLIQSQTQDQSWLEDDNILKLCCIIYEE